MIAGLLLVAVATDIYPSTYALPPAGRLSLAGASPVKRSRYRIAPDPERLPSAKDRAFADDGTRCNVVGEKRCTSHGRRLFSTAIDD